MLTSKNFIFKKQSFLALLSLSKVFEWIHRKSVLYLTRFNQLISAMSDYFPDYVTFIDVLFETF